MRSTGTPCRAQALWRQLRLLEYMLHYESRTSWLHRQRSSERTRNILRRQRRLQRLAIQRAALERLRQRDRNENKQNHEHTAAAPSFNHVHRHAQLPRTQREGTCAAAPGMAGEVR